MGNNNYWESLREIDNILVEEENEVVIEGRHENFDNSSEDSVLEIEVIDENEDEDELLIEDHLNVIEDIQFNTSAYAAIGESVDCNSISQDISNVPCDESVSSCVDEVVEKDNEIKDTELRDDVKYDRIELSDHSLYTQNSKKPHINETSTRSDEKTEDEENKIKDKYCWMCHKDGESFVKCNTCPRVFHLRCLNGQQRDNSFYCLECMAILKANNLSSRCAINMEQLSLSLIFIIARLKSHEDSDLFWQPVDKDEFPQYKDYVVYPMDFSIIENKVMKRLYTSTEAFFADVKWIVHNSIVFNTSSSMITTIAKTLVKICKKELSEMDTCAECYYRSLVNADTWFLEACKKPHILLWAKLKSFPPWPAKAMKCKGGMVDVRFFGVHDRSWVCLKDCYLYSETIPQASKTRRNDLEISVNEVKKHIEKLIEKYGEFVYAPNKIQYDPVNELKQLQLMLPKYKPEDNADVFLVEDNITSNNFKVESPVKNSTPEKKWAKGKKSPRGCKRNLSKNKDENSSEKKEEVVTEVVEQKKRTKRIIQEDLYENTDNEKEGNQKRSRRKSKKMISTNNDEEEKSEEIIVEFSQATNQKRSPISDRKVVSNHDERDEESHGEMMEFNEGKNENISHEEIVTQIVENGEIIEEILEYDEREEKSEYGEKEVKNENNIEYVEREDEDGNNFEHYEREEACEENGNNSEYDEEVEEEEENMKNENCSACGEEEEEGITEENDDISAYGEEEENGENENISEYGKEQEENDKHENFSAYGEEKEDVVTEENDNASEYEEEEDGREKNENISEYNERRVEEDTFVKFSEYNDEREEENEKNVVILKHDKNAEESIKNENQVKISKDHNEEEELEEERESLMKIAQNPATRDKKQPKTKSEGNRNTENEKKYEEILHNDTTTTENGYRRILRRKEIQEGKEREFTEVERNDDSAVNDNVVKKTSTKRNRKLEIDKGPFKKIKINEPVKLSKNMTISLVEEEVTVPSNSMDNSRPILIDSSTPVLVDNSKLALVNISKSNLMDNLSPDLMDNSTPTSMDNSLDSSLDSSMDDLEDVDMSPVNTTKSENRPSTHRPPVEIALPNFDDNTINEIKRVFYEYAQDLAQEGDVHCEVIMLKKRLKDRKAYWTAKLNKLEEEHEKMRNNFERRKADIRNKAAARRRHELALSRVKFLQEKKDAVYEAKTRQWCTNCKQLARFYCCWNTSYCTLECQKSHWNVHSSRCCNGLLKKGKFKFGNNADNELPKLISYDAYNVDDFPKITPIPTIGSLKRISQENLVDVENCDDH